MESRRTLVSPPGPCGYLPDRLWQIRYEIAPRLTREEYMQRLDDGWRRMGTAMFRPVCPACRMCQSLRIPVETFRPDRSQRRAWKTNEAAVRVRVASPVLTRDKLELYRRFHAHQTDAKGWPLQDDHAIVSLLDNPFPTEEWTYWIDGRLSAVGYVDRLARGLSAIYFFYDPDDRDRSLGTFNVLSVIAAARDARLPYVYLGYYIPGYSSLAYKARFRPNEVLGDDGTWRPFQVE